MDCIQSRQPNADVVVYLQPNTSRSQQQLLDQRLHQDPAVAKFTYWSQTQAYVAANACKMPGAGRQSLPASFFVRLSDVSNEEQFISDYRRQPGVADVVPR